MVSEWNITGAISMLRDGMSFRLQCISSVFQSDPNPTQFYKWIKENLDPSHYNNAGFINALVTVLVKYITQVSVFLGT
jgi:sorbitol-specific phosphotransferase system component IIC